MTSPPRVPRVRDSAFVSGLLAAALLAACGPAPRPEPPSDPGEIALRLAHCDGTRPHDAVAADLDRLRRLGPAAAAAAPAVADLVRESAPLYRDRGPNEATRLRGWVLATLAAIGPPASVVPEIGEILRLEKSPYLLAAAARVAGALGPKAAAVRDPLARLSDPAFADDLVSLDAYNVLPTKENGTTARAEAAAALARLGPAPEAHKCCEAPAADDCAAAVRAIPAGDRVAPRLEGVTLTDQDGASRDWKALFDRPAALAFFYTQCDNPKKCSSTVARMGALQKALAAAHLSDRARCVLMTLDPAVDSDLVRKRYAEIRGFDPSSGLLVSSSESGLRDVVAALGVNANFGQGRVNIHGVELFVMDGQGRVVRRHGSGWTEAAVVSDLAKLVEAAGSIPATRPSIPVAVNVTIPADAAKPLHVKVTLPELATGPLRLRPAVEAIGSYQPCAFGRFMKNVEAQDKNGMKLLVTPAGDGWTVAPLAHTITWDVDSAAGESEIPDLNVSTHRRPGYALVSGYATFLMIDGFEDRPHDVTLTLPADWRVAWSLPRADDGSWRAANAIELLDEPFMAGTRYLTKEVVRTAFPSFVHVYTEDESAETDPLAELNAAQERAVAAILALDLPPLGRPYHVFFELRKPAPGRKLGWALEHGQSFQAVDRIALKNDGDLVYHLVHHMLHAWIPRRLYTDALHPARQIRGTPSGAIWFAEGFPQYLAFVAMGRAHVQDRKFVLFKLARRFAIPLGQSPSTDATSMADRSLRLSTGAHDEWFYGLSQGAMLAMWIDAKLRSKKPDGDGFVEAMHALYARWHDHPRGIPEDGLEAALQDVTCLDLSDTFRRHVRGVEPLPLAEVLDLAGIAPDGSLAKPDDAITPAQLRFRDQVFK